MLSDQLTLIHRFQFFVHLLDQFWGYSFTELQFLFQLSSALALAPALYVVTHITFIIDITLLPSTYAYFYL